VPALVRVLADHGVEWVLSGSAVLVLYGADLRPNDLDVVPALDQDNLDRLARLLVGLRALPAYFPAWAEGPSLAQCLRWRPDPVTPEQIDHLFVTAHGMLDIPPSITGTYRELAEGATFVEVAGLVVRVCDPGEVLRRLDGRARRKDLARAREYDAVRERVRRGVVARGDLLA
jgi:hypothetical protein